MGRIFPSAHPLRLARRSAVQALALALAMPWALAQTERPRESLVKADFLHKLAGLVEWPEGTFARPDTPLRIGVLGDEQIWRDLRGLAADRGGRPMTVVRLENDESLMGFHILYLKPLTAARAAELLTQAPEGVLTVADAEGSHPKGCVLGFFIEDGRVRFSVSLEAAAKQRLRLSSRLLSVARIQGAAPLAADPSAA